VAPAAIAATESARKVTAATATSRERERERERGAGVAMGERGRSRLCRTQREEGAKRDGKMRMKP
jgi:hypothetical protein